MQTYNVPNLTPTTPEADQTKLLSALQGVKGVQTAELRVERHEVAITMKQQQEPKRADIASAVLAAGFALAGKP